jgi:trk system potassium uptake protein TrkH
MNFGIIKRTVGWILLFEAVFFLVPLITAAIYWEAEFFAFLICIGICAALGGLCLIGKPKSDKIYAKEGFVITALCWTVLSAFGALPFVMAGTIPNYVDALFETVSGFTTTGATVIKNVEILPHSLLFWRSFTHFIGGMGILVFMLAILPKSDSGIVRVFRAEAPGPSVGKLVSKLSFTARILYGIYVGLFVVEFIMLLCGGMPVFDSLVHSFGTAGTGGFSIKNDSIAFYNSTYIEMVIAVFMFLFGLNFNFFYFALLGNFKKIFKSEEFRAYILITVSATLIIAINILSTCINFGEALRYSIFQVSSISSSTGYVSADFDKWPALSKSVIVILMMVGACGGSTGGGIKVSRFVIMVKSVFADIKRLIHPRAVVKVKFEGELLDKETEKNVHTYFTLWIIIVALVTLLLCIDVNDFLTNFTATLSCIGNIGPGLSNAGLNMVGPMFNFAGYAPLSKILLSAVMLFGRLEIFPMLILFIPRTWRKN